MLQILSPLPDSDGGVGTLDLHSNYIGDRGVLALIPALALLHKVHTINLSDNGLRNAGVSEIAHALKKQPHLTSVNLSRNKFTRVAGKELLGLITVNANLKVIEVEGTGLDDALKARILKRLKR